MPRDALRGSPWGCRDSIFWDYRVVLFILLINFNSADTHSNCSSDLREVFCPTLPPSSSRREFGSYFSVSQPVGLCIFDMPSPSQQSPGPLTRTRTQQFRIQQARVEKSGNRNAAPILSDRVRKPGWKRKVGMLLCGPSTSTDYSYLLGLSGVSS